MTIDEAVEYLTDHQRDWGFMGKPNFQGCSRCLIIAANRVTGCKREIPKDIKEMAFGILWSQTGKEKHV